MSPKMMAVIALIVLTGLGSILIHSRGEKTRAQDEVTDLEAMIEYHYLFEVAVTEAQVLQDLRDQVRVLDEDLDLLQSRANLARAALPIQAYACKGSKTCQDEVVSKAKAQAFKMYKEVDDLQARIRELGEETNLAMVRHEQAEEAVAMARELLPCYILERLGL